MPCSIWTHCGQTTGAAFVECTDDTCVITIYGDVTNLSTFRMSQRTASSRVIYYLLFFLFILFALLLSVRADPNVRHYNTLILTYSYLLLCYIYSALASAPKCK